MFEKISRRTLINLFFALETVLIGLSIYLVLIELDFTNLNLEDSFYALGQISGLVAFFFLATLIIVGDLARLFDKKVGLDSIIKFQRKFALFATALVLTHPIFFILSYVGYARYLLPDFGYVSMIMGTLALYLFILIEVCSVFYKRISNKFWQIIHVITYVLFLFALYHAINLGSQTQYGIIPVIIGIVFVLFIIGIIYRTSCKLRQIKNSRYKVQDLKWETHDTFSLYLKSKNNYKKNFKAGQFCFLRINKHKLYARHPFTISNSPSDEYLRFTIKIQGRFTKYASKLKRGDELTLEGPFGIFTSNKKYKNLIFIAGGVGITPFMSLISDKLKSNFKDKQKINLIYGCRDSQNLIFKKELNEIKKVWFKLTYVFSEEKVIGHNCKFGFINKEILKEQIKGLDLNETGFYICGPEILKNSMMKTLPELGVKKSDIHKEDFFW